MYCPNCGNKNSGDQRFCRSCGLGLEKIAQSLTEQLPTKLDQSLEERKERLERLGVYSLSVFGLGILSFVLYQIFFKLMLTQGKFIAALGVLAALVFVGSGLVSVFLFAQANELKEASAKRRLEQTPESSSGEATGKLLEAHIEPTLSVTDRTTELLDVERGNKRTNG